MGVLELVLVLVEGDTAETRLAAAAPITPRIVVVRAGAGLGLVLLARGGVVLVLVAIAAIAARLLELLWV